MIRGADGIIRTAEDFNAQEPRGPEPPKIAGNTIDNLEKLQFVFEHIGDVDLPSEVPDKGTLSLLIWARIAENREGFYRMWKEASFRKSELEKESKAEPFRNRNRALEQRLKEIING